MTNLALVILYILSISMFAFLGMLFGFALAKIEYQKVENERLRLLSRLERE